MRVEEVMDSLPSLLVRLKTLQSLHRDAATYASRINLLEETVKNLLADSLANKELIKVLQQGIQDNITVFEQNAKQVK
jgi:hypothetical protein